MKDIIFKEIELNYNVKIVKLNEKEYGVNLANSRPDAFQLAERLEKYYNIKNNYVYDNDLIFTL